MFETVELGVAIDPATYASELQEVRAELLEAQLELVERKAFPVVVVVSGVDGAGRSDVVNALKEWLDVRHLETHAFGRLDRSAAPHNDYRAFWTALPARGKIGLYFGSWYTDPLRDRTDRVSSKAEFREELARIAAFERTLADDGALIVKLWLHLSKEAQRARLTELARADDPRGRFSETYWRRHRRYKRVSKAAEELIRRTDTARAPWTLVEATDPRARELTAARALRDALVSRLGAGEGAPPSADVPLDALASSHGVLAHLDLGAKLSRKAYDEALPRLQRRLAGLAWDSWEARRSTVMVFEGWDAAGKGSTIRRVTAPIDARLVRVIAISAPTDEEKAHHYLWRFWRQIPEPGHTTIYDRSWYGRVLVERVEGFATTAEHQRAYAEINEFEERLVERGINLVKFFLHIDRDEQLRRFEKRERVRFKRYKITDEDWRNREKWDAYETAVDEMIARTSTAHAPWTLVAANDKPFARITALETIVAAMTKGLRK